MSAFLLASVAGVPFGLYLGTKFGWHVPLVALVILGLPVLVLALFYLPRLDQHLQKQHEPSPAAPGGNIRGAQSSECLRPDHALSSAALP